MHNDDPQPPVRIRKAIVMMTKKLILTTTVVLGLLTVPSTASAAPVKNCGEGVYGAYHNVTTRAMSCSDAQTFAARQISISWPMRCSRNCRYKLCANAKCDDIYRVKLRHLRNRYRPGCSYIDVRSAQMHGNRVVRFQIEWDCGE